MADQVNREFSEFPSHIQLDKPSVARIYDYVLGGYHNFEIDRQVGDRFLALMPDMALAAQVNRAFLRRSALFVARQGIDQFIDLGSGIPTIGNLHEIVRQHNPDARTVYVDNDPVAVAHSEAILGDDRGVAAIQADIRFPKDILEHPKTRALIDFSRPVGLFAIAIMHYIPDASDADQVMRTFKDAIPAGSYLTIGALTHDGAPADAIEKYEEMRRLVPTPGRHHPRQMVLDYFSGFDLVEPGLVYSSQWRPDGPDDLLLNDPSRSANWVGVARKRGT